MALRQPRRKSTAVKQPRGNLGSLDEGDALLALAQQTGGFGIFEWHVKTGKVRLSPNLRTLYGLSEFDGRYATWRGFVFREDVLRLEHAADDAFALRGQQSFCRSFVLSGRTMTRCGGSSGVV